MIDEIFVKVVQNQGCRDRQKPGTGWCCSSQGLRIYSLGWPHATKKEAQLKNTATNQ